METECDFMEIDNNIASRLQVPSPHQQRDTDIPEGLPVPMLANFDHFENSDETESSFMTGDVEGEQKEASASSNEQMKDNDESGLTVSETTQDVQTEHVEELEDLNTEISSVRQGNDGEGLEQNIVIQGGILKDESEDLLASFGEGPANIESIHSNPLLCGESQVDEAEERTNDDKSNASTLMPSNVERRVEDDVQQSIVDNQTGIVQNTSTSNGTGPLLNPTQATNELKNLNDISVGELFRTESPDRDFVFVNRDGTAQGEHRLPRHPLENSDEFQRS